MSNSIDVNYISGPKLEIRPCALDREWMQEYQRFAYKCLPLAQANQLGWELLMNVDTTVEWTGSKHTQGVIVHNRNDDNKFVASHFGNGTVTFNLPYLFTTPKGVDLWVRGPSNPEAAPIYALEGVVETWWNPFTFTMNWRFNQAGVKHTFHAGEPICRIVPIDHNLVSSLSLAHKSLWDNPELAAKYQAWNVSRTMFSEWQYQDPSARLSHHWQKHYYKGVEFATSSEPVEGHQIGWGLKAPTGELTSRYARLNVRTQQLEPTLYPSFAEASRAETPNEDVVVVELKPPAPGGDSGGCPPAVADMDKPSGPQV